MTAVDAAERTAQAAEVPNGPCSVYLDADGSLITRLSAHLESRTGDAGERVPGRVPGRGPSGSRWSESVDVYVGAPELARLIDVLNAAYTRVARRPHEEPPPAVSGAA